MCVLNACSKSKCFSFFANADYEWPIMNGKVKWSDFTRALFAMTTGTTFSSANFRCQDIFVPTNQFVPFTEFENNCIVLLSRIAIMGHSVHGGVGALKSDASKKYVAYPRDELIKGKGLGAASFFGTKYFHLLLHFAGHYAVETICYRCSSGKTKCESGNSSLVFCFTGDQTVLHLHATMFWHPETNPHFIETLPQQLEGQDSQTPPSPGVSLRQDQQNQLPHGPLHDVKFRSPWVLPPQPRGHPQADGPKHGGEPHVPPMHQDQDRGLRVTYPRHQERHRRQPHSPKSPTSTVFWDAQTCSNQSITCPRFNVSRATLNTASIDAGSLLDAGLSVLAKLNQSKQESSASRNGKRTASEQISRNGVLLDVKGVFRVRSKLGSLLWYSYGLYGHCIILVTSPPSGSDFRGFQDFSSCPVSRSCPCITGSYKVHYLQVDRECKMESGTMALVAEFIEREGAIGAEAEKTENKQ
ncbi:hypothetical protein POTOM_030444 [Populus tomentosa]|uniref:Uncharacterized protein n=1 Tax=Populus tomentosa TaxID=118781 RepID=A0A8X7ZEX4_POPTO|nr:hypothetical protein POTOM_030444 [Populus tomentosa]